MDKLLLVILFLFSVISINAQDDFECIDRFLKGINQVSLFPSSTITMYCYYTQNIKCDNENKVTLISINSNNSSFVLDSSYLNCFSKLENFELSNFTLNDNIFYSPITSQSLNTFSVIFPKINSFSLSQQIKLNMSILKLAFTDLTSISPITLQYLQNVKKSIIIRKDLGYINYLNNGNQIKLPSLYISSLSIPDLTNIEIEFLQLTVPGVTGGDFNTSSFENFKSFVKVKNFVYQSGQNRYPIELHSLTTNNIIESLEMSLLIGTALSNTLNFTMFTSLKKLKFSKSLNLLYNSNLPIGLYPQSLQEFDFIQNSLINFPDLSIIKSPYVSLSGNNFTSITIPFNSNFITTLDLSNNPTIINTIDDSFCKTITILKNNSMNGILPDCIKCHLSDNTISSWYSGNNFDLTPLIGCSSIIPKMKILNGNTYLYGSNLGFLSSSIKSIPSINFQIDIPSTSFYTTPQYKPSTLFNISFTSSGSNKQFTVSNDPNYPTPKSITFKSNSLVEFIGEYFTYDKSIVTILIDSTVNCIPIEVDFYRILCNLTTTPLQSNSNIPVTIKIDNLSSSLKINSNSIGVINPIENCKDSCNRGGSCNFETLKCQCDQLHFGEYCENKAIQCNDPTCGGIGICDKTTGQCDCGLIYTGDSCELPAHWVSSIEPPLESGGIVILNGYFSNQHSNLSVTIGGNQPCTISNTSPPTISTITCSIGPGVGIKNITVIQNTVTWFSNSMFQYFNENYDCPNHCSNHGTCNSKTGICSCTNDWSGFDCSSKSNHQTNTTIDNGSVTLTNQDTTYSISIYKLIEIDFNGNIIKEFNFTNNLSWDKSVIIDQITNSKTIKYNKQIIYDSTNLKSTNITTTFEEVTKTSERSFAGVTFQLERGSIKLSISITNYPYKNYLNSLQLLLISDSTNDNNNCEDDNQTNLEKDQSQNSQLDYITIKKLDKVLKGRFINRVISDDRSTFITNSINQSKSSPDKIIITFNLPHCTKECLLDPDFSVLVDPDFSTSCDSKSRKWVVPVAVVVSVVGFVALVVVSVLLYKKNRINIQIRLKTLRQK
ncbi:hypothetical protein ACTFIY_001922 [Dictyostelium cf. discoideum]